MFHELISEFGCTKVPDVDGPFSNPYGQSPVRVPFTSFKYSEVTVCHYHTVLNGTPKSQPAGHWQRSNHSLSQAM